MAPISRRDKANVNDFILTLSDEDTAGSTPNGQSEPNPAIGQANGKKRKRAEIDTAPSKASSRKKIRKSSNKDRPSSDEEEQAASTPPEGEDEGSIASDFEFQVTARENEGLGGFDGWDMDQDPTEAAKSEGRKGVDIDDIIARRRQIETENDSEASSEDNAENRGGSDAEDNFDGFDDEDEYLAEDGFGMGAVDSDNEGASDRTSEDEARKHGEDDNEESSDEDSVAAPVPHPDDLDAYGPNDEIEEKISPAEAARHAAFFAPEPEVNGSKHIVSDHNASFQSMSLSRPILRGLASVGFATPTPIQAKTIPVALLGKDVVGGAVTGSGKTAAFVIPILERLLYRPKKLPTTRVAILTPTRELAAQCFSVARRLASYTDVTFALLVGGLSVKEQERVLRGRPDVVIATPGRFIDHARNAPGFAVDGLEILVLDEADRMLEDGFADELNEILAAIPRSRQTMLFSATMTESVDQLVRAGLNKPVRLMVDARRQTVKGLVQEFVRLRPGKEESRLACLLYLCETVFTERVLIFFRQKKEAHRVRVIFGLCGMKAAELHGSMTQEQRLHALNAFRTSTASFLLATDLASRGLDIKNIATVLNYSAPQTADIYLHRVGRTARAGRSGIACTLAADADRKVLRAAVRAARGPASTSSPDSSDVVIRSRTLPADAVEAWQARLAALDADVDAVLAEEKEARATDAAERDLRRGENLVEHGDAIAARPRRTWFASEREKGKAKEKGRAALNGMKDAMAEVADGRSAGKKKGKLSGKEKKRLDERDIRTEGKSWKKGRVEREASGGAAARKKVGKEEKSAGKGKAKKGAVKSKGKR